jgi:HlyD family secretion protein
VERTKIRSPIDGVVINRAVDAGQTVQASFAAPTLFKLARDLREMQITANISEADIGGVAPGQAVAFSVDAFPGETFAGKVREVRNNTTITNNIVTYPTIITVENPDLKLRPRMTANVTITLAHRSDVLRVPNAALRYRPPENATLLAAAHAGAAHGRTLYIVRGDVDAAGRATGGLEPASVHTGLSDSAYTEIVSGIDEGAVVATGTSLLPASAGTSSPVTNPFVPRMPGPRGTKR